MPQSLLTALDWLGIIVFAMTGALVASRKEMDVVGFSLMAVVAAVGGGTVRDVLLGSLPVAWVREPAILLVCVIVAVLMFFLAHIPQSRYRLILWLDAVGLALFAVVGADKALAAGAGTIVAIAMGVATATFGGIIRDVLGGEVPLILRKEIYATAALAGSVVFLGTLSVGMARPGALLSGFAAAFAVRSLALYHGWSLPPYRARPGHRMPDRDAR